MSNLPQGWTTSAIGDLIELNPKNRCEDDAQVGFVPMPLLGKSYLGQIAFEPRQWGDVKTGYTHFADGDVLLAKITPCFENGKAGIAENLPSGIGAGSTEYFVCRAFPEALHPKYLLAFFKTENFVNFGATQMTGSVGHRRVPKSYVTDTLIPLAPLPEQKRIADKLDTVLARVDACRERLNRVPIILKRFRQSVLASATSGQLTADWRKQNGGWVDERDSTIAYDAKHNLRAGCEQSVLPNGWVKETLAKVIHLDLGYAFKSADFKKKGVRLLRGDNIEPGKLRWNEPAFYDPSRLGGYQHLLLNAGDVVLAMDRPIITNGLKIARVHADDVPCVLVQRVCRFIPTDRISADYLYQTLCDNAFIGYLQGAQNGTQIPHISGKQILSFEVPIPPVAEQHEIVRRVETLFAFADRLEARLTTARTATDRLTPALLAKAFRGELVPQDPNDEPAAELLKRLAATRTATSAKPRRERVVAVKER